MKPFRRERIIPRGYPQCCVHMFPREESISKIRARSDCSWLTRGWRGGEARDFNECSPGGTGLEAARVVASTETQDITRARVSFVFPAAEFRVFGARRSGPERRGAVSDQFKGI